LTEIIHVENLTKTYPRDKGRPPLRAVDGINFTVYAGEVFGFLGPNGAGKTTTIRMLTGLTRPSAGSARIMGFNLASEVTRIKKQIGVVPEASNLYDELTAYDNLIFTMQLYGVPRAERQMRAKTLLARFHLSEKRDTPFARLSRGMKRALTIAAALAHHPPLVFLDEPTTGLDVVNARGLRRIIAALRQEGVTIFLTTHYLEEAERLCDRIALIVKGKIVALDTVEGLKATTPGKTIVEVTLAGPDGQPEKRRLDGDDGVESAIRRALQDAEGRNILAVDTLRPSLEDVFVQLTGLSADVMLAEKGHKGG